MMCVTREVEFDILFGSGIDTFGCLLDAAESVGIVERKGSWYSKGELRCNIHYFDASYLTSIITIPI